MSKKNVSRGSLVLIPIVLGILWILQCSGPMPAVEGLILREPAEPGQPYQVDVQIRNRWRGHGEIQLTAHLHDQATGKRYEGHETAVLDPGETIRVIVPVHADKGDYQADVETEYPPR